MKITYSWLKDFVKIDIPARELADKLTMAGLEVTSLRRAHGDYVFEIEVTSNRPDWLSIMGIAREAALACGKKIGGLPAFRTPPAGCASGDMRRARLYIKDKKACQFYCGRIIYGVKVGRSPAWLAKRLRSIGLRTVNNIVDATNYVLFNTGQPLHAFDLDKIRGSEVTVRFAAPGEKITTIDGACRDLSGSILVIADSDGPIAIAGIMGGKETEVSNSTRNIFLEGAYFSPELVRKASRAMALSSDSSFRFERSVDKSSIVASSNSALSIIQEIAGGRAGQLYKIGSQAYPRSVVRFNAQSACARLGIDLPAKKMRHIFEGLGLKTVSLGKGAFKITVPGFRQDVKCEADLMEELGRIYGYNRIPLSLAQVKPQSIQENGRLAIRSRAKKVLAASGFSEVITYSLLPEENINNSGIDCSGVMRLKNPLSAEQEILRPALLPGLLNALGRNLELGNSPCAMFEIGNCFGQGSEYESVGMIVEGLDLPGVKGKVEALLNRIGLRHYEFSPDQKAFFTQGASASLVRDGRAFGFFGQIKKEVLRNFKIDAEGVLACEVNMEKLEAAIEPCRTYRPLPKYPAAMRDLSIVVNESLPYRDVLQAVSRCGLKYLESVKYKDVFCSGSVGEGKKSVTISLEFRSPDSTLTDSQVNSYMANVISALSGELGATVR